MNFVSYPMQNVHLVTDVHLFLFQEFSYPAHTFDTDDGKACVLGCLGHAEEDEP